MQSRATETNQILWFYSFFRFSIWKKYFQLSALPLFSLLRGPCFHFPFSLSKSSMNLNLAVSWLINLKKNLEFDSIFVSNSNSQWPALQLAWLAWWLERCVWSSQSSGFDFRASLNFLTAYNRFSIQLQGSFPRSCGIYKVVFDDNVFFFLEKGKPQDT